MEPVQVMQLVAIAVNGALTLLALLTLIRVFLVMGALRKWMRRMESKADQIIRIWRRP